QQHAFLTVDVGDGGLAAGGGGEARVVGEVAGGLGQLADLDARRGNGGGGNAEVDAGAANGDVGLFGVGHEVAPDVWWPGGNRLQGPGGWVRATPGSGTTRGTRPRDYRTCPGAWSVRHGRRQSVPCRPRRPETTTAAQWAAVAAAPGTWPGTRITSRSACGTGRRGRRCP